MRQSCRRIIILACILTSGCTNPFKVHYAGQTASSLNASGLVVLPCEGEVRVIKSDRYSTEVKDLLRDGMVVLGESNWMDQVAGSDSDARQAAKAVGASVAVWTSKYVGGSSGYFSMTGPTVSTTYGSGVVNTSAGSGTWRGSATTYGTQTTMVPYVITLFEVKSVFLAPPAKPPRFGVHVKRRFAISARDPKPIGVKVEVVVRDSPADRARIWPEDEIIRVGGDEIWSVADFERAIASHARSTVEVELRRASESVKVNVALNE